MAQIPYPVVHCNRDLDKLLIFQLQKAQVVSPVGNIWIGPSANFPHYMDHTFATTLYLENKIQWIFLFLLYSTQQRLLHKKKHFRRKWKKSIDGTATETYLVDFLLSFDTFLVFFGTKNQQIWYEQALFQWALLSSAVEVFYVETIPLLF